MDVQNIISPVLVISRNRQESRENDDAIAELLAARFNAAVLSIPFLYDIPAQDPILLRLRGLSTPASFFVPLSRRSVKSILNQFQIPYAKIFDTIEDIQIPVGDIPEGHVEYIDELHQTRWYPIIDVSRCTGCFECVNYCLFGVYSIGADARPFVEQPESCRDGCPACARVCPGKAIMFPLYADRSIAGYEEATAEKFKHLVDLVDEI